MSKAIRSAVVAVATCFAMAASAQGTVQIGKDGSVKVQAGDAQVDVQGGEVNVRGGKSKVKVGAGGVDIQANEDGDMAIAAAAAGSVESDGERLEINGVGRKDTLRCDSEKDIEINGTGHDLTITGECQSVEVNGAGNKVKVEAAAFIEVNGTGNAVTWKRGVGASKPKVERSGLNNKVSQEK